MQGLIAVVLVPVMAVCGTVAAGSLSGHFSRRIIVVLVVVLPAIVILAAAAETDSQARCWRSKERFPALARGFHGVAW